MRSRSGRWWTFFSVFVLAGLLLTSQPAWAALEITGTPPNVVDQGNLYDFTPTLTAGEGGNITFNIINPPEWATFNTENGRLSGTPTNADVGTYTGITITVTDDANAFDSIGPFDITVADINDPPTRVSDDPITTWSEDAAYRYTLVVEDIDDDAVSAEIIQRPSWLNINQSTEDPFRFVLEGTPQNNDVGTATVDLLITDERGGELPFSFQITVNNVNDAPRIISNPPVTTVAEDTAYLHTIVVRDVDDGDDIQAIETTMPQWLTLTPVGSSVADEYHFELSGTPNNENVGQNQPVEIIFSDNAGANVTFDTSLTVTNTNDAPEISGDPVTSVFEDSSYSFSPTVIDIDEDINGNPDDLIFTRSSTSEWPAWLQFNTANGRLSGTPRNDDVGITQGIVITVSDGIASASLAPFDLTVNNTNDPPTISGQPGPAVEDAPFSFVPTASDPDLTPAGEPADTLTFSVDTGDAPLPAWLSFNTNTGELSGTPTNDDVGIIPGVAITVTDDKGASETLDPFDLTVQNVNDPPTFIDELSTPPTSVNEDNPYTFTPVAEDIDVDVEGNPDALTYSIEAKPDWADFDPQSGQLDGIPGNDDVGQYSGIVISVSDNNTGTDTLAPFSITVNPINDDPVISGAPRPLVEVGGTFTFQPTAEDVDVGLDGEPDELIFDIENQPRWTNFDIFTGKLVNRLLRPTAEDIGVYSDILITVYDQEGGSASLPPFQIEVVEELNLFAGNIDGMDDITLSDAITGLQVLSDISSAYAFIEADVNGDGQIGMEEVIFVLRNIAQP